MKIEEIEAEYEDDGPLEYEQSEEAKLRTEEYKRQHESPLASIEEGQIAAKKQRAERVQAQKEVLVQRIEKTPRYLKEHIVSGPACMLLKITNGEESSRLAPKRIGEVVALAEFLARRQKKLTMSAKIRLVRAKRGENSLDARCKDWRYETGAVQGVGRGASMAVSLAVFEQPVDKPSSGTW